jgi:hypothetical protein
MKREPNPEDPAYRDKELYERYKQINDPKKPTEGDLLKEKGGYIDTGEGVDAQGDVLLSEQTDIESLTNLQKQQQDAKKYKDFDDAVAGAKSPEDLIKAGKIRKRIEEAEDEIDPETGWPMYLAKGAWWLMQKVGEGFDWVDKQAGIPGTDIDVYHARRKILDPLSETHLALGILGEIFLPDSIDIATAGFSYIPNRFRKAGKAGIKLWADITKAGKTTDEWAEARRIADKYNMQMNIGYGDEISSAVKGDNYLPNPSDDVLLRVHEGLKDVRTRYGTRIVQEAPIAQRLLFNAPSRTSGGMRGSKLVMKDFKNYWAGNSSKSRDVLEAYMTRPNQYVRGFFERQKEFLKPAFLDEYGEYLENTLNIPPEEIGKSINLHHITPIKASAPLYEGTTYGDEAWFAVTDTFNNHGLFPGAPMTERGVTGVASDIAAESNFMYALKEPHDLLHDEFLAETIGKQGQKFFTPSRKRLIKSGKEGRIMVANEYALHIKKGEDFIKAAMRQMDALFSNSGVPPEELAEILHKATNKGELKILDTDLFLKSVNNQLKNIAEETSWEEFGTAYGDEVPEVLQKHLNQAIQNFFQRIQKEYGLSGKGGLGKPPVNPYE